MKRVCAWVLIAAASGCRGGEATPAARGTTATATPPPPALPTAPASAKTPPPKLVAGPDGRHAVVMREHGEEKVDLGGGETITIADDRVVLVDVETLEEIEIGKNDLKEGCSSLNAPRLVDEKTVVLRSYGLGVPTIHNMSVCAIDIPSRKIHLLAARTRCALFIPTGRYKGDFFVNGMRFKVGNGPSADPSIVAPNGKLVQRLATYPFAKTAEQHPECNEEAPAPDVLAILEKL